MSKEIQEYTLIQGNTTELGINDSRINLVRTVLAVRQGLYAVEQGRTGLAGAVLPAEEIVIANAPIYSQILSGETLVSRTNGERYAAVLRNTEKLAPLEITDTNTKLESLMRIIAASATLADLRRLERYLSVQLPTTETSFRVLKAVATDNKEVFGIPDQDTAKKTLAKATGALSHIDRTVTAESYEQTQGIEGLRQRMQEEYTPVAEQLMENDAPEVEEIKIAVTDKTIYDLRREITQIDSVARPTSRYEILVNAIIDEENLTAQNKEANLLAETNLGEYRSATLRAIARMRAKERIIQEFRIARLLQQRATKMQDNSEQIVLMSGQEIERQAEKYVKKHKDVDLVEKERNQLENELEQLQACYVELPADEYKQIVQEKLSQKEYSMAKPIIEGRSDSYALYKLAEAHLRERIIDGLSEEQVKTALLQKLTDDAIRGYIAAAIPEAVDQAVLMCGLQTSDILSNPEVITTSSDAIITNAISLLREKTSTITAQRALGNGVVQESNTSTEILKDSSIMLVPYRRRSVNGKCLADGYRRKNGMDIYDSYTDASGLDWRPMVEAVKMIPSIAKVGFHNLQQLKRSAGETVRIAIEYCPLYAQGKLGNSSLLTNVQGVEGIINSRVGKKWIATETTLQALNGFFRENDRDLEVKITFADLAVLAGTKSSVNEEALLQHGELYYEQVSELFERLDIPCIFQRMSDVATTTLRQFDIGQFVIAEGSAYVQSIPENPEVILRRLGFSQSDILLRTPEQKTKARRVLRDLLTSCDGNIDLARGLVGAYCMTLPMLLEDCDMHLGMERSQNLLDLSTVVESKKAAMNVLVA